MAGRGTAQTVMLRRRVGVSAKRPSAGERRYRQRCMTFSPSRRSLCPAYRGRQRVPGTDPNRRDPCASSNPTFSSSEMISTGRVLRMADLQHHAFTGRTPCRDSRSGCPSRPGRGGAGGRRGRVHWPPVEGSRAAQRVDREPQRGPSRERPSPATARAAAEHAVQEQDEVFTQRGRGGEQLRQPPPAHFLDRGPRAFRLPVDDRLEVLVGQAGESQRRVAPDPVGCLRALRVGCISSDWCAEAAARLPVPAAGATPARLRASTTR